MMPFVHLSYCRIPAALIDATIGLHKSPCVLSTPTSIGDSSRAMHSLRAAEADCSSINAHMMSNRSLTTSKLMKSDWRLFAAGYTQLLLRYQCVAVRIWIFCKASFWVNVEGAIAVA